MNILTNQENIYKIISEDDHIILICSDNSVVKFIISKYYDIMSIPILEGNIKMCISGRSFTILLDNNGKAYVNGCNQYDKLSVIYTHPNNKYIMCVASLNNIIFIRDDNEIIVTGLKNKLISKQINKYSKTKNIIKIFIISSIFIFIFDDDTIEGFEIEYNIDEDGHIIDSLIDDESYIKKIFFPKLNEKIIYIECDKYFCRIILLTNNNNVYIFSYDENIDENNDIYKNKIRNYSNNNIEDNYISCSSSYTHITFITDKGLAIMFFKSNKPNIIFQDPTNKYIMSYSSGTNIILLLDNGTIKTYYVTFDSICNVSNVISYELPSIAETLYYGSIRLKIFTISLDNENLNFNFSTIGNNNIDSLLIVDDDNYTLIIKHLKKFCDSGFPRVIYDINKSKPDNEIPDTFPNILSLIDINLFIKYWS